MGEDARKRHFVEELKKHYQHVISGARGAELSAAEAADAIRNGATQKEDAKAATSSARMSTAHRKRREAAARELEELIRFASKGLPRLRPDSKVGLGALVDVRVESEDAEDEKTLFFLPVGAGVELTGPGGDGFVSVITPASAIGKTLLGALAGDYFDVELGGKLREWSVLELS